MTIDDTPPAPDPCPSPGDLIRYARGELPPGRLLPMIEHLGRCERCRAAFRVAWRAGRDAGRMKVAGLGGGDEGGTR